MEETRGRKPSKALFLGQTDDDSKAVYNLSVFHDRFVALEDITEYKAAIELVGSWEEWNRIKRDWPEFCGHIAAWIEEIETKLKAEAIAKITQLCRSETQQAFQAAKFLATKEYSREAGKGRPSKAERRREAKVIAQAAAETKEEEGRILKVLNGGVHEAL